MNVISLYSNFPHTEGLLAWKYLPTKFIVDMSELVLRNNFRVWSLITVTLIILKTSGILIL